MTNPQNQLTRTCNACGVEKPLSAFLELGGAQGTSYGKICSSCRSTEKTEKPAPTLAEEEKSTNPSGSGIRGKEKIHIDTKHQQKIHSLKDLYRKEEIKKQNILEDKIERINLKEEAEKKHREHYIAPQKQADPLGRKSTASQQASGRQQTQKTITARAAVEQQRVREKGAQAHADVIKSVAKDEARKTSTDFNNLFHAIEPGKIEMQGEIRKFFTWLGNSAPIVRTLNQGRGLRGTPRQKEAVSENKSNAQSRRQR